MKIGTKIPTTTTSLIMILIYFTALGTLQMQILKTKYNQVLNDDDTFGLC